MSPPTPTQVALGVHQLGDHGVNFYLIEGPDGLILIDAGVPAHLEQLPGLGAPFTDGIRTATQQAQHLSVR